MGKKKKIERTPVTFRGWLTELQRRNARVIAAMRKIQVREFWEEAMEEYLDERANASEHGESYSYENVPRDAESASMYADEGLVAQVDEHAKSDNVRREDALYTVFSRHIEMWAEKLMG